MRERHKGKQKFAEKYDGLCRTGSTAGLTLPRNCVVQGKKG